MNNARSSIIRAAGGVSQASEWPASSRLAAHSKTPFVLVHGAWLGAWSFERLVPLLARHGHAAVACDLPGHGLNARFPQAYMRYSPGCAGFQTEISPNSSITLDDYVTSIIQTVEDARQIGGGKVILVGHSMGGALISAVAEQISGCIEQLVYISAFMPKSGNAMADYIHAPENDGELVSQLLASDPTVTGALRIDHRTDDTVRRSIGQRAFCGDIADEEYYAVLNLLTPDAAGAPFATPIATTRERWGSLRRHYIMCLQDYAIRPAVQRRFIEEADAFAPEHPTVVHQLDASHAPFLSQPDGTANLLVKIAASNVASLV